MAQKLKGVGGVLGGLISQESATTASPAEPEGIAPMPQTKEPLAMPPPTAAEPPASPAPREVSRPKPAGRVATRRGRPPGVRTGEAAEKEKVTLRLNKELMDDYRDWSWEERCQLGELVERAMVQYRKSRRQKSP